MSYEGISIFYLKIITEQAVLHCLVRLCES